MPQPVNLIPRPFSSSGGFSIIPDTKPSSGRASFTDGFPVETQRPLPEGGVPPNRTDFNGILYMLSSIAFWQQSGGQWTYLSSLNYETPSIVYYQAKLWWCVAPNGPGSTVVAPGTNESYWIELLTALSEMGGGGSGGGTGINTKVVLTNSQTWTAPVSGTYKVTCIGAGGGGGRGGNYVSSGTTSGGAGGGAGGTTSFGSLLSALGGGGGGGGGGGSGSVTVGGSGGGGGAGRVAYDYFTINQGTSISVTIGDSGLGGNTSVSTVYGGDGGGITDSGGRGRTFGRGGAIGAGGCGAPGASSGSSLRVGYSGTSTTGSPCANAGSGGLNYSGYGGGGGGGCGGGNVAGIVGSTGNGSGGEGGGDGSINSIGQPGNGGNGGSGAIILEYYVGV